MKKISLGFCFGLALGAAIFYFSVWHSDQTQAYVTALGLVSIFLAYAQFRVLQTEKESLSVIEQLHFFREDVLKNFENLATEISKKITDEQVNKLQTGPLTKFEYGWAYVTYRESFNIQTALGKIKEVKELQTKAVNSLEEFSWSLILHKTIKHEALRVTRDTFIQFVEQFAHQILMFRGQHPDQMEGIKRVYTEWSKEVLRETPEESIDRVVREYREWEQAQKIKAG